VQAEAVVAAAAAAVDRGLVGVVVVVVVVRAHYLFRQGKTPMRFVVVVGYKTTGT
jgi:hypothetical protein